MKLAEYDCFLLLLDAVALRLHVRDVSNRSRGSINLGLGVDGNWF